MTAGALTADTDAQALGIALRFGADHLHGVASDAMREAKLLLGAVSGKDVEQFHHLTRDDFTADLMARYYALIERRNAREPMSHILGYRDFWDHRFKVTADVLDPRPDTETLVAEALKVPFETVLDLGTGSGCIVISLLCARETARGMAVDVSSEALIVARENAATLEVTDRLTFAHGSWFDPVTAQFDLIVSNPPYIAKAEMAGLAPELGHEPRMALTDEADGLTAYREIIQDAPHYLTPGGQLMVEIGFAQGADVVALFEAAGFAQVRVILDINQRERVVAGRHI